MQVFSFESFSFSLMATTAHYFDVQEIRLYVAYGNEDIPSFNDF